MAALDQTMLTLVSAERAAALAGHIAIVAAVVAGQVWGLATPRDR